MNTEDPQTPLPARSAAEIHYYLMVRPCDSCGKGPWRAELAASPAGAQETIAATCQACGHRKAFTFETPDGPADRAFDPGAPINPTDQPSRLIDVAQWLSLFYLFIEQSAREPDKPVSRRLGYQGALCLAEALKFYGDDELPPPEAFFSETGREAFRRRPENFARQRLMDMRAKLPSLSTMAGRVRQDAGAAEPEPKSPDRRWWRFWKRTR